MLSVPLGASASFLRSAFGLTSLNPYGLNFGSRHQSGLESRPFLGDRDGAWFLFEEMAQAAEEIRKRGDIGLRPLERDHPADSMRRLYLDEYQVVPDRTPGRFYTLLGAAEYRHLSPMKCVGESFSILVNGIQNGSHPER